MVRKIKQHDDKQQYDRNEKIVADVVITFCNIVIFCLTIVLDNRLVLGIFLNDSLRILFCIFTIYAE